MTTILRISRNTHYTGFTSPPYPVQLLDDQGKAINLTGVPTDNFNLILQDVDTLQFQKGTGSWTITDAAAGKASYQWSSADLVVANADIAHPKKKLVYVTVLIPGEVGARAFDPDTITIVQLSTGGNAVVTTQDVNLIQVNSSTLGSGNPVPISGPVTTVDGGNISQGAKADAAVTDPSLSASEIALLKGLMTIIKAGVPLLDSAGTNKAAVS